MSSRARVVVVVEGKNPWDDDGRYGGSAESPNLHDDRRSMNISKNPSFHIQSPRQPIIFFTHHNYLWPNTSSSSSSRNEPSSSPTSPPSQQQEKPLPEEERRRRKYAGTTTSQPRRLGLLCRPMQNLPPLPARTRPDAGRRLPRRGFILVVRTGRTRI